MFPRTVLPCVLLMATLAGITATVPVFAAHPATVTPSEEALLNQLLAEARQAEPVLKTPNEKAVVLLAIGKAQTVLGQSAAAQDTLRSGEAASRNIVWDGERSYSTVGSVPSRQKIGTRPVAPTFRRDYYSDNFGRRYTLAQIDAGAVDDAVQTALLAIKAENNDDESDDYLVALIEKRKPGSGKPVQDWIAQQRAETRRALLQKAAIAVRESLPRLRAETNPYRRAMYQLGLYMYPYSPETMTYLTPAENQGIWDDCLAASRQITDRKQRLEVLVLMGYVFCDREKLPAVVAEIELLAPNDSDVIEMLSGFVQHYLQAFRAAVADTATPPKTTITAIMTKQQAQYEAMFEEREANHARKTPGKLAAIRANEAQVLASKPVDGNALRGVMMQYLQQDAVDDALRVAAIAPDGWRASALDLIRQHKTPLTASQREAFLQIVSRWKNRKPSVYGDSPNSMDMATLLHFAGDDEGARQVLRRFVTLLTTVPPNGITSKEELRGSLLPAARLQKECGDAPGAVSTLRQFCQLYDGEDREVFRDEQQIDYLEQAAVLLLALKQPVAAQNVLRRPMESLVRRPYTREEGAVIYNGRGRPLPPVLRDYSPVLLRYGAGAQARIGDLTGATKTARSIRYPAYRAVTLAEVVYEYRVRNTDKRRKLPFIGTGESLSLATPQPLEQVSLR